MFDNKLERAPIAALKSYPTNARTHTKSQIKQIAASIERFGFTNPLLVDDDLMVLAGHGRLAAAQLLGMTEVPVLKLSHLNNDEKRAYVIADNRLAEKAGWDRELLAIELKALVDLNFEVGAIGFDAAEIDFVLETAGEADPCGRDAPEDDAPAKPASAVTRVGDVWLLGRHRLICADARNRDAYSALLGEEAVDAIFTDPPYNVPIEGFVGGKGKVKHESFAMGCGEMSEAEFQRFLTDTLGPAGERLKDGGIAFVCMDWRHMREVLNAGEQALGGLKNLCVWAKTNGGMGSLYRSQHELVFVFKRGEGEHTNNVELGKHGRNRTNVWCYAGANTFKAEREAELEMHPTVKPVALVQDALKDVTNRREIVLDPFGGSGSTLIAAEKCGRHARLLEIDPAYCDVIVRRYQTYAAKSATLLGADATFEDVTAERLSTAPEMAAE